MKREKYICTKSFRGDKYDDWRDCMPCVYIWVEEGETWIFEDIPEKYKIYPNVYRMTNKKGRIAITRGTFMNHFKFVEKLEE